MISPSFTSVHDAIFLRVFSRDKIFFVPTNNTVAFSGYETFEISTLCHTKKKGSEPIDCIIESANKTLRLWTILNLIVIRWPLQQLPPISDRKKKLSSSKGSRFHHPQEILVVEMHWDHHHYQQHQERVRVPIHANQCVVRHRIMSIRCLR
jgi:hypothetical protein